MGPSGVPKLSRQATVAHAKTKIRVAWGTIRDMGTRDSE
jgi:hypothetical protein